MNITEAQTQTAPCHFCGKPGSVIGSHWDGAAYISVRLCGAQNRNNPGCKGAKAPRRPRQPRVRAYGDYAALCGLVGKIGRV